MLRLARKKITLLLIARLKKEPLFQKRILTDIRNNEVTPLLREGSVYFFYKNVPLLRYEGAGFVTTQKYLVLAICSRKNPTMIKLADLYADLYKTQDIIYLYDNMKTAIKNKLSDNDKLIYGLMADFYGVCKSDNTLVLDNRGVLLHDFHGGNTMGLLDKKAKEIRFYEIRNSSKFSAWFSGCPGFDRKKTPEFIIGEINKILAKKYARILTQYKENILFLDKLLDINISGPQKIIRTMELLVFDPKDRLKKQLPQMMSRYAELKIKWRLIKKSDELSALWAGQKSADFMGASDF